MLAAGTGVRFQPGPEEVPPEIREAREAINKIYPGFDKLVAIMPRLQAFIESVDKDGQPYDFGQLTRVPQFGEEINRRWEQHAEQTLSGIQSDLAKDYGVDKLSPRQERMIGLSFMDWLEEDRTGARADRYARGDGGLKGEFLTEFRGGFVDPFRRTQDAAALAAGNRNRNLPPAPQGSGVAPPGAPQAPKSLDQVTDDAWNTFQAANSR